MAHFPVLDSGAITQYPSAKILSHKTSVIRYLGGDEQRIRRHRQGTRRWVINVQRLQPGELERLLQFFREQRGSAGTFSFVDPWTGETVENCCFESDEFRVDFLSETEIRGDLRIREVDGIW